MSKQDEVEGLLTAVRALVAARSGGPDAPLVLTEAQRVAEAPRPGPDGDGFAIPNGDAVLRDFVRLTCETPTPSEPAPAEAAAAEEDAAPKPNKVPEPEVTEAVAERERPTAPVAETTEEPADLTALRMLIREVLREEVRTRMGKRINENILRIVQQELDRRFGPPPAS